MSRILRFPDLSSRKGIDWTRKHIYDLEKRGDFPQRIRLGPNSVGWWEAEIDEWLSARARASRREDA